MTDHVHVGGHATYATSRNLKKKKRTQTCVAKQPKLFKEILKKPRTCVPVQPVLTSENPEETQNLCACATCQEVLKKPKTCVPVQPVLPQGVLNKPKTCVPVQPVTSGNPEETQNFCACATCQEVLR